MKILFASDKTEDDLFFHIFDPFQKVELPGIEEVRQEAAPPDLHILIVEDDFSTRHLEATILEVYGNCEIAVNGDEAIRAFEKRALGGTPYDVIFLDILIPEPDGHAVLKTIREFEEERNIHGFERSRVIVVSNLRDMENIFRSFRRQSDSYIIKPVTKKKVERELKRLKLL